VSIQKEFNKIIDRKELTLSQNSDNFIKHIEKIYEDLVSTPHFNDEDVLLEDSGVCFFHKETKEELSWLIVVMLKIYINQLGHKASHVIKNKTLLGYIQSQEYSCLGVNHHTLINKYGDHKFIFEEDVSSE
jgi:hypothetical protein